MASQYNVKVTVIGGKDLAAKDTGRFASGLSDPYAIVELNGKEWRSEVIPKELNPTWNFACEGSVNQLDGVNLVVTLWDKDKLGSDFMGTVSVPLTDIGTDKQYEEWLALQTNSKGKEVSGTVGLKVKISGGAGGGIEASQADLEDSNVAGIGGEENRALRKEAAMTEEAWKDAGTVVGTEIWRIEKFQVVRWPTEEHGKFYQGDSYIVLVTRADPESGKLLWDVHFWLGQDTTQDEMGTAAYKTVELDDLLDDGPVQHREVQGYESRKFLSYFKPSMKILSGGVDSGFRHVEPESYEPRLLHVKRVGNKACRVMQVDLSKDAMNQGDTFLLDAGLKIYIWEGSSTTPFEKQKAGDVYDATNSDRGGKCERCDPDDDFWALLGGEGEIQEAPPAEEEVAHPDPCLWKINDEGGISFEKVADAPLGKHMLDSGDVFVVDGGDQIFVWVGSGASYAEKKEAMPQAQKYLTDNGRPSHLNITRILEHGETEAFNAVFQ